MAKFQLQRGITSAFIVLRGRDDHDKVFELTLDRVWAGNLVQELEDWLSGDEPEQTAAESLLVEYVAHAQRYEADNPTLRSIAIAARELLDIATPTPFTDRQLRRVDL